MNSSLYMFFLPQITLGFREHANICLFIAHMLQKSIFIYASEHHEYITTAMFSLVFSFFFYKIKANRKFPYRYKGRECRLGVAYRCVNVWLKTYKQLDVWGYPRC